MADFTIDTGNPVQQSAGAGAQAVPVNAQATGQQGAQMTAEAPQIDTGMNAETAKALDTLSAGLLGPKIKEAAQQQFMEGVQRAAAGDAIKDIVNDQPELTQIFGPSSAVQGARAYTAAHAVASFGASMEAAMPALSQQGPEALQGKINELSKSLQTGDPATDMAITGQITDQSIPLYKQQAKGHYIYQQQQANIAQTRFMTADTDAYQSMSARFAAGDKTITKADVDAQGQRMLGGWQKFADQTDKSYEDNVLDVLKVAADKGNFGVISLFDKNGLLNQMTPAQQVELDTHLRRAAPLALAKVLPQFSLQMEMITKDMTQNPAGVQAKVDALNAQAAAVSGVDPKYAKLIPEHIVGATQGSILTHQMTQQEKAQEEARKFGAATTGLANGQLAQYISTGITDKETAERVIATTMDYTQPQKVAATLNPLLSGGDFKSTVITSQLNAPLASEDASDAGANTIATYRQLTPAARNAIWNGPEGAQQRFIASVVANQDGGMPLQMAWKTAKLTAPAQNQTIADSDKEKVDVALRKVAKSENTAWWGHQEIDDASLRMVSGLTKSSYLNISNGGNVKLDQAAEQAFYSLAHNGSIARFGSSYMVTDPKNPGVAPLDFYTKGKDNVGMEQAGDAFDRVQTAKLETAGLDADHVQYRFRLPDTNGVPQYGAAVTDDKGGSHMISWNGAEIKQDAIARGKTTILSRTQDALTPPTIVRNGAMVQTPGSIIGTEPLDEASQTPTR